MGMFLNNKCKFYR